MKRRSCRSLSMLVLPAAVAALTGCANLSAIREFADISTSSAQYSALVTAYVQAPESSRRYWPPESWEERDRQAERRAQQKEELLLMHRSVAEYMDAIGKLAADEVVVYDRELDALAGKVKELGGSDRERIAACSTLGKLLGKALSDGWRQRHLRWLVDEANPPFQTVVSGLEVVVTEGFAEELEIERTAMDSYYRTLLHEAEEQGACARAGKAALEEWREVRLAALEGRRKATESYGKLLNTIAAGHQKLFEARGKLSSRELQGEMRRLAKELRSLYGAVVALQGR